jgi:hypothetical protein
MKLVRMLLTVPIDVRSSTLSNMFDENQEKLNYHNYTLHFFELFGYVEYIDYTTIMINY